MTLSHAVVHVDHHKAEVLHFDADNASSQSVKEHQHYTRQHGSEVRSEHEFFGQVCDALAGVADVLVVGSHQAQAAFRHYVDKHRPLVAKQVVAWETIDHPSEGELLAFARKYFVEHDGMAPSGVRSTR